MIPPSWSLSRLLFVAGGAILLLGLLVLLLEKLGLKWGRLPGDVRIEGEHGGFYFPITTCIVLSLFVTLLLHFFGKR